MSGGEPADARPVRPVPPARLAGPGSTGPDVDAGPSSVVRSPTRARRVLGGVLVGLAAVEAAILECFLVPLRVGRWPVPLAILAAVLGNVLLARWMGRAVGRPVAALLPPLIWLAIVLLLAVPRPEGDLVVPGSWSGLAFLFLGSIAGAYGVASVILPKVRGTHPVGLASPDPRRVAPRG